VRNVLQTSDAEWRPLAGLKILQLHARYREHGGENALVEEERNLLAAAGAEVLCLDSPNPESPAGAAISLVLSAHNPLTAARVSSLLKRERFDLVHVHNTWFGLSTSVVRAAARHAPVVMTLHNFRLVCPKGTLFRDGRPCEACIDRGLHQALRHRCYRDSAALSAVATASTSYVQRSKALEGVRRFAALSAFSRRKLTQAGIEAARIDLLDNFVPDPGRRPSPPSSSEYVLFVGRLSPEKGVDLLLRAWTEAQLGDLRLLVVGDGPMKQTLEAQAPASVTFCGFKSSWEIKELMHGARALVFPSQCYEGQPLTLLEGLAAGVPIICSDLGGIPEVACDGGGGTAVEADSVAEWASALVDLANEAGTSLDIRSAAARRRYEERFAPAKAVEAHRRFYGNVLDG